MKKVLFTLLLIVGFAQIAPVQATTGAPNAKQVVVAKMLTQQNALLPGGLMNMTADEFLKLTPKKVKAVTGEKLSLKEVIALKAAQKAVKKELRRAEAGGAAGSSKSQLVALLLAALVGGLGIHRFYLGYVGIGIIQLLTLGGCGIWALIDLIRIITGDLKPADGSEYDPKL